MHGGWHGVPDGGLPVPGVRGCLVSACIRCADGTTTRTESRHQSHYRKWIGAIRGRASWRYSIHSSHWNWAASLADSCCSPGIDRDEADRVEAGTGVGLRLSPPHPKQTVQPPPPLQSISGEFFPFLSTPPPSFNPFCIFPPFFPKH